jgi:ribonuclease HII
MSTLTVAEIEEKLSRIQVEDDPFFEMLKSDERKGVQQVVSRWLRKRELENQAHEKFIELNQYEYKLRSQGFQSIVGIDEVGRGPLAGPVVAAAVILPEDFNVVGIDDSKKLTEAKREALYEEITSKAIDIGIGIISSEEIDQINIYEATKKAMLSAIAGLQQTPDFLLIDAMKLDTPYPFEAIIKGDAKSISIAAASIIAKVTRDRMMKELAIQFPDYGFDRNMGYGTKEHLEALQTKGITPFHRKSFAPIKDM